MQSAFLHFHAFLALIIVCTGCRTGQTEFQTDLSSPGWRIRQGQAVWRPPGGRTDIAGELLLAVHPSGNSLVQFIKTPFPVVTAHRSRAEWQIVFGTEDRTFSGRGSPPSRFIWLHLASCLESGQPPPRAWSFAAEGADRWRFENRSSGEALEGYLRP